MKVSYTASKYHNRFTSIIQKLSAMPFPISTLEKKSAPFNMYKFEIHLSSSSFFIHNY